MKSLPIRPETVHAAIHPDRHYLPVPPKPAFTVQATYRHIGKMKPRLFDDEPLPSDLAGLEAVDLR